MGDVLTAVAEIDKTPLAKLVVRQAVLNQDGEVCADGSVTLGFIDAKTFRPVRCPELLARIIENHLNDK
jgi:acyl-CoA thioester hydrolase